MPRTRKARRQVAPPPTEQQVAAERLAYEASRAAAVKAQQENVDKVRKRVASPATQRQADRIAAYRVVEQRQWQYNELLDRLLRVLRLEENLRGAAADIKRGLFDLR